MSGGLAGAVASARPLSTPDRGNMMARVMDEHTFRIILYLDRRIPGEHVLTQFLDSLPSGRVRQSAIREMLLAGQKAVMSLDATPAYDAPEILKTPKVARAAAPRPLALQQEAVLPAFFSQEPEALELLAPSSASSASSAQVLEPVAEGEDEPAPLPLEPVFIPAVEAEPGEKRKRLMW